jgi:prolyl oligopeptidase PreP (S9A serine peptidase family)
MPKEPKRFLDPNTFSKDGTTSLGGLDFSKDGSKVAYAISEGGSDWRKVIIMDAITNKIIEDDCRCKIQRRVLESKRILLFQL